MVDLDKQFAAMADVSEEDTAYDFVIDEDLRIIAIPERGVVLGVEGDKDANRIRFRMNKTWRGYDMSKFDLRINYQNANRSYARSVRSLILKRIMKHMKHL